MGTTGCPVPRRASSSIFTSRATRHGWSHWAHAVTSLFVSWKSSLQCSTPGWMCHLLTFVCREKQAQVSTSLSLIPLSTSSAPCEHSHMNTGHTRTHSQTHTEAVSPLLCGGGPCRWTRVSGCHPSLLQHIVGTLCVLCLSPCQMHAAPWRQRSPRPCPAITSHSPQMHPSPASVHQPQFPRVLEGHLPLAPRLQTSPGPCNPANFSICSEP